jgi:putative peptidoglycan lipid II flippase
MLKAIALLMSGNMLGKLMGLIREVIVAALYGTSNIASAYRGALSATFIPTNFFTAESLNAVFIPLYKKYERDKKQSAINFSWVMLGLLGTISLLIAVSLYISAPSWIGLLVPGFNDEAKEMTIYFVQIMAIGVPFYVLCSVLSYYEMSNNQYFMTSVRPTVQSVGLIVGALLAYKSHYIGYLAWGFTGAYILLFVQGGVNLYRKQLIQRPKLMPGEVKLIGLEFWKTFRPLLLLPIILQGNIIIERRIASFLGTDVIASLDYAKFVTETGLLLLAVPVSLVGLSKLSGLSIDRVKTNLEQFIPVLLLVTIPISVFCCMYSREIIELLYSRGLFNENSTDVTGNLLAGLAIGLWAQIIAYILQKALNSQLHNKFVLYAILTSVAFNMIFNILFYKLLGPISIGIGSSIYGVSLMFITAYRLQIIQLIIRYLLLISIGVCISIMLCQAVGGSSLLGLSLSFVCNVVFWLVYCLLLSPIRVYLLSTIRLIRMKRNAVSN